MSEIRMCLSHLLVVATNWAGKRPRVKVFTGLLCLGQTKEVESYMSPRRVSVGVSLPKVA